jgi:filamin
VVAVTGANPARPSVTDVGNGTYSATYTPTNTGKDLLTITLNGVPITGSPFASTVGAGPADPSQTTATVPAGCAGEETTVAITLRDAYGNGLTGGGDMVSVAVSGPNEGTPVVVEDHADSTYRATYQPTRAGTDDIDIMVNGLPIGGSPFTGVVRPGPASPSQTQVMVPEYGLPGRGAAITVRARDAFGNRLITGGDGVEVLIRGANTASPKVTDVGNGAYQATYTPRVAGHDDIVVSLGGNPVAGSPFELEVRAGSADASQTVASVPSGTAGMATTITVTARDALGNALTGGGDRVAVTVRGANTATPEVKDNGNATYTARYTPRVVGVDEIEIALAGEQIPGSPFTSIVDAGGPDPSKTRAAVPATCTAGATATLSVVTYDAYGNRLSIGGATVGAKVSGANERAAIEFTDNDDGTYTGTYAPTVSGVDEILFQINDTAVRGGRYTTTINPAKSHPGEATAVVPQGKAGKPTTVTVITRDQYGNDVVRGGQTLSVMVGGANQDAEVDCHDNGDGTYTGRYTPKRAGVDYLAISLNGTAIGDSPCKTVVQSGIGDPAQTTVMMPSVSRSGTLTTISIVNRDQYGNELQSGGDEIVVTVNGVNGGTPVAVADVGNGTYLATYTPTKSGEDQLAITVNGAPIEGSPFTHVVDAGAADPEQSTATGPVMGKVGVIMTISVITRDRYGNQLALGGEKVDVLVTGANEGARVSLIDNKDGTYFATYTPAVPGKDRVSITVAGRPIGSGPIRPVVAVGAAHGRQSTATVPAGKVGRRTVITIRARDASGNDLSVGGDKVTVAISVANTTAAEVVDNRDGTYTATYMPRSTGTDYIAIGINGTSLAGSPFVSEVEAGATDPGRTEVALPDTTTAGRPTDVFIRTRDAFGNEIKRGGQLLRATVTGANNGSSMRVTDNEDGTYTVSYTPTKAGEDRIALVLGGEPLRGGPDMCRVRPGAPSAAQTSASVEEGVAGEMTAITVTARDAYRNPTPGQLDDLGMSVVGVNEGTPLQVTDNRDGTYTATYTPTIAGTDLIAVSLSGGAIRESPITAAVRPGPIEPDQTRVLVPDGQAGNVTTVTITTRDAYGNASQEGGADVVVRVDGANAGTPVDIKDHGDGTYAVAYRPTRAGRDTVSVTVNGRTAGTGTWRSVIAPAAADPRRTSAAIPAGVAGRPTAIVVTTRDAYNNRVVQRGSRVAVQVSGTNGGAPVTVHDNGDGTFAATYTPTVAGDDAVTVSLNGTVVDGSPFAAAVAAGPPEPMRCTAVVPPGRVGMTTTTSIQVRDAYGNAVSDVTGLLNVRINGANTHADIRINQMGKGSFAATYTPSAQGTDTVVVAIDGDEIAGSPFSSIVTRGSAEMAALIGSDKPPALAPPRPSLRATMVCPRCSVGEISDSLERCELCGYAPVEEIAPVPQSTATPATLQDTVQRALDAKYALQALIRHTERSAIFVAKERGRREPIALKIVPLADPLSDEAREEFEVAIERIKTLRNPHVVSIFEHGATPRFLWYTMEYVEGTSLADKLQSGGPLDLDYCLSVITRAGSALDYLHRMGVVHGNVKPSNIMLGAGDQVRITDIAIPCVHALSEYMAPEQFEQTPPHPTNDQFALGVTTYECLAGRNPLAGSADDLTRPTAVNAPAITEVRADLPAGVGVALERAMRRDPRERFRSLAEFTGALGGSFISARQTAEVAAPASPTSRQRVLMPEGPKRRFPLRWVALFIVVAGAASVGYYLRGRPAAPEFVETAPVRPSPQVTTPSAPPPGRTASLPSPDSLLITVTSDPVGQVFIDGQLMGLANQLVVNVTPGTHTLVVRRPGFLPFEQQVQGGGGDAVTIPDISLVPRAP